MKRAVSGILFLLMSVGLFAGGYGGDGYSPTYFATISAGTLNVTGLLKLADGTAAAPSLTFTNDPNTGIYNPMTYDNLMFTVGGTLRLTLNTTGLTSTVATTAPNFISNVAEGTAPYACTSTTKNTNLNADLLDDLSSAAFGQLAVANTWTGTYNWFKGKAYFGTNLTTPASTHDNTFLLFGDGVANDLTLGAANTTAYGIYSYPYITLQSALTSFMGAKITSKYMDDGTARAITNAYGFYVSPPQKAAGAQAGTAVMNMYTLYVEDPLSLGSSSNIGIYNGGSLVNGRKIQTGVDTLDGQLDIYSEQGATDYTASIKPHTVMTSNMTLYLPADEPTGTLPVTVTSGGQIGYKTDYNPDNARPNGWPQTAANAQDNEFNGEVLTITGTCNIVHNGTGTSTVTSTAGDAFEAGDDGLILYLAGIPYVIDSVTSTSIVEVTEAGALPANATGVEYIVGRLGYWAWTGEAGADSRATTYNQTTYPGNLYIDHAGAQYKSGVYGYFTKLLATPIAGNFTVVMKVGFPPNQANGIGLVVTEAGGTNPFGCLVNFAVSPSNGHYDVKSATGTTAWENSPTVANKIIYSAPFQYLRIRRIGTGANGLLMAVSMDGMNWIEVVSTGFTMANPLTNVGLIMSLPAEAATGANHPSVTVDWIRFE
ncbi:MAG TPA: hypothetical protein PLA03_11700 [Acidobacteriota bacterium]|nr:hypothetical protein [Acidobacteriota bacterium]